MRIAVTGLDGFTGRYVEAILKDMGVDHVALAADLTDSKAVDQAVAETEFDRLIHLAAIAFAGGNDWRAFYEVNQLGTVTLLEAVARHRKGARCILASSAQVYGLGAEGLVNETHICNPVGHYAISKYAMELAAPLFSSALEIVIARPFNYTGVGQEARYLVPKIVDHFRRRAPEIELGNLFVRRDFGDVRSVAEFYCMLALADTPPPHVNVGTGALHSIQDIVDVLTSMTGHGPQLRTNPAFIRANDVPTLGADIGLAKRVLTGWAPRPIEDTLGWMLRAE
ncbi:MAG: GDP-mannose 4,6-dehydratase [Sphingopyxis sp.]|nr:GDP-mannose 4,6-dehydratase [Sphingopyxis sp.]